ncbi:MAG: type II toxin-antitoxin system VapB family antitoxin [Aestuariivirga sp.]
MRTNIEIDDRLMKQAMRASGAMTKRETVEKALKLLVRIDAQGAIRRLRGKLRWEGDLDAMRRSE